MDTAQVLIDHGAQVRGSGPIKGLVINIWGEGVLQNWRGRQVKFYPNKKGGQSFSHPEGGGGGGEGHKKLL